MVFCCSTTAPGFEISALFFGIGIGLTIDEFALWVYLDDVYWAKEGRKSIDATVIAVALMGLIVLGVQPIDFDDSSTWAIVLSLVIVAVDIVCVVICFMKGRMMHGLVGFFISVLATYEPARLGKPDSPRPGAAMAIAVRTSTSMRNSDSNRYCRTERFKNKVRDAIGGTTEEVYDAKMSAKMSENENTQEAVDKVRERAESAKSLTGQEPHNPASRFCAARSSERNLAAY